VEARLSGRILVLGAAGRLGFSAAEAFRDAGWQVKGLVRPRRAGFVPRGVESVEVLARDDAIAAARGCDVVLNALNPAITEWRRNALSLAHSAIACAEDNGATLIFPGSVWNFGQSMPALLDESTPMRPTTRKGAMRVEIEQRIREASDRGMRVILLRAGDFFGAGRGSWFDLVVVKDIERRRLTYPGPLDVVHAWAYLPDLTTTMVRLAERRQEFATHETFGFAGHSFTGAELIAAIEAVTNATFNVRKMSWWMLKTFGQMLAMGRELSELEYLWRVPHRIDGGKLKAALGDVPHTPLKHAVAESLRELGYRL
jgi:nucleoside-diphosphate-sugar epimerase